MLMVDGELLETVEAPLLLMLLSTVCALVSDGVPKENDGKLDVLVLGSRLC